MTTKAIMKIKQLNIFIIIPFILLGVFSCSEKPTPKPRAYLRIDIPEAEYVDFNTNFPYSFQYSANSRIVDLSNKSPYWINIVYPTFKAKVYLSYHKVDTNLPQLLEDAHSFAFKHISKAQDIRQDMIISSDRKVYGMIYNIRGSETATPINFYLTDSTANYLRGALYFDLIPNNDSLAPVIEGIEKDINHLIESFEWKKLESAL